MARKDKKDWGLEELLSIIGFVFELLRVVVNALRKRGGTIDDLRRFLREPDLVDRVFDMVVQKPMKAVASTLLSFIGTVTTAAMSVFSAKEKFVVDTSDSAEVKIAYVGDNFRSWLLNKVERAVPASVLSYHTLLQRSLDNTIIKELGGEAKVEATLSALWQLLVFQRNGESGVLLTNGNANMFYIRDTDGVLRAVHVSRDGYGWDVDANSVAGPRGWDAGDRVFSCNF